MGKTVQIDSDLLQNMVSFIGAAGTQLDKLAKEQEQAKAAAPEVVETLVQQGLLAEERKSAAVGALGESHVRVLDVLKKTASHVAKKEEVAPAMGAPAPAMDKAAEEETPRSKADRDFLRSLGFGN